MSLTDVLAIVGAVTVVFHLLKLSWRCWFGFRQFILSELWHVDLRTYGQWAAVPIHSRYSCLFLDAGSVLTVIFFVTGATSGIGKAYASELARRGLDVVLVSRSDDKLQTIAKEIEDQYGRKTRTIQVDFTEGPSIYPAIAEELQDLEIGILVNNVGMTYVDHFSRFLEIPDAEQKITKVINCNILSVTQMTRLVLPGMVERGTGLIINLSSELAVHPQPLLSLYSATKIFVTYFSQCLHAEYQSKGIIVQCVAPFLVSTNMTKNIPVNCFVKSASGFVREALNTVGYSTYTSGCMSHALQDIALTILLPEWFRMSPFCIRKLQNLVEACNWETEGKKTEKPGKKEE